MSMFNFKKNVPFVAQFQRTDCGLACVAMILRYYESYESMNEISRLLEVGRDGTTMKQIHDLLNKLNLDTKIYQIPPEKLNIIKLPAVLYWKENHFVVLEKIKNGNYYILDPSFGKRKLSFEDFSDDYSGIAIYAYPNDSFKRVAENKKLWKTFSSILFENKILYLKLIFYSLISYVFTIGVPFVIQNTIDTVAISKDKLYLNNMFGILGLIFIFLNLTLLIKDNTLANLKTKLNKSMNFKVFSHLLKLPYKFFDTRDKSSILYSLNNITMVREAFTDNIVKGLINIGSLIFILFYISLNSKILAAIGLILIFINMFAIMLARKLTVESTKELLLEERTTQSIQNESVQSILGIKMLALEQSFLDSWVEKLDKYLNKFLTREKLNNTIKSVFAFLQSISPAIILYVSVLSMIQGTMSLGKVLATYSLSASLFSIVNSLSSTWIKYQNCKLILERLNDITSHPIEKEVNLAIKHNVIGDIELKNIYFSYSKNADVVLRNINLKIKNGSKIGIVGKSGAGKSTLAKLLVGLYEPISGEILIDGINLENIDKKYFRKQMGIIPQDAPLFNKSIYDNIVVDTKNVPLENVKEVCRLTQINQEIESIPMGYYTPISECGQNLSGGQRQRIVLARTLLTNPKLLLFDEATSFLDNINEKKISDLLSQNGCTRIIIAHRLSTVLDSDVIFVMDGGEITAQGTHNELLEKSKLYQELYLSNSV